MSLADGLLGFTLVAALVTVVPGLDTAIVLRAAISRGVRHGYAAALGVGTGALLWGIGAALGLSALLTASRVGYDGVRLAGAAYLIWLGLRLLRDARSAPDDTHDAAGGLAPVGAWHSWRQGLLTNLLNPKIGVFYVAVMPQFLPTQGSHLLAGVLMALVHDALGLVWFSAVILAAARLGAALRSRRVRRVVDGLTGAVLVGFGARLALHGR